MNQPVVFQELIDLANSELAGYQNAVDSTALNSFLNEGKDEVWSALKQLNDEYFLVFSQSTVSTDPYYFGPLTTSTREYALPSDFREIKFIEVVTQGYTNAQFVYKDPTSPEFRDARRLANSGGPNSNTNNLFFLYTIVGKNQFVMADFPPIPLTLKLWYIRSLADYEPSDSVDEILFPYTKKICTYAVRKALLSTQDQAMWAAWKQEWRDGIISVTSTAAPRNQSDPVFTIGFCE